ncbi:MAG: hypothetical protein TU36_005215 [Vulcanisaeta sp. AZ3]|nr:MAG: hypothetical protein TU36_05685 [Vulcanisaeta sp. AZ3]
MVSRDVVFSNIERIDNTWIIKGRVRSRTKPGVWHNVEVRIKWVNGEALIRGKCDCEAFTKGHMICWHILHLTNVFIKNRHKLISNSSLFPS